jgi:hypothetical protein
MPRDLPVRPQKFIEEDCPYGECVRAQDGFDQSSHGVRRRELLDDGDVQQVPGSGTVGIERSVEVSEELLRDGISDNGVEFVPYLTVAVL